MVPVHRRRLVASATLHTLHGAHGSHRSTGPLPVLVGRVDLQEFASLIDDSVLRIHLVAAIGYELSVRESPGLRQRGVVPMPGLLGGVLLPVRLDEVLTAQEDSAEQHRVAVLVEPFAGSSIGIGLGEILRKVAAIAKALTRGAVLVYPEAVLRNLERHLRLRAVPQIGLAHIGVEGMRERMLEFPQCRPSRRSSLTAEGALSLPGLDPSSLSLIFCPYRGVLHAHGAHNAVVRLAVAASGVHELL
mmetsp:Transcript_14950/g.32856  ORF Transcript_14950/g.32856 Transcript_14950/m.32856 type:complete len:246 (+) Transcript_14950:784-1521(+)